MRYGTPTELASPPRPIAPSAFAVTHPIRPPPALPTTTLVQINAQWLFLCGDYGHLPEITGPDSSNTALGFSTVSCSIASRALCWFSMAVEVWPSFCCWVGEVLGRSWRIGQVVWLMVLIFCLTTLMTRITLQATRFYTSIVPEKVLTLSKHCKGSEGLFEQRTTAGWQRDKRTTLGVDSPWWLWGCCRLPWIVAGPPRCWGSWVGGGENGYRSGTYCRCVRT